MATMILITIIITIAVWAYTGSWLAGLSILAFMLVLKGGFELIDAILGK